MRLVSSVEVADRDDRPRRHLGTRDRQRRGHIDADGFTVDRGRCGPGRGYGRRCAAAGEGGTVRRVSTTDH